MSEMAELGPGRHAAAVSARRRAHELEFLPAALEILETPASPVGRAVALAISAFLAIAVGWACLGHIDIVAVAQGKIIPSGRTKSIQPLEAGVVRAIHVEDGQAVRAGDVLVELDATETGADELRLTHELIVAELDAARLRALVGNGQGAAALEWPADADPALVRLQETLLLAQLAEQESRLSGLQSESERKRADIQAISAQIDKLEAIIPLVEEQVEGKRILLDKGLTPKMEFLRLQQALIEQQQDLVGARARLVESEAALAAVAREREQAEAGFRRDRLAELAEAEQKAAALRQELVKAAQRRDLQRLTAPIDGVVQQLAVHTIGGVVTPAQELMKLVPRSEDLEIEALVLNKDVGFVEAGQQVEIKLETFQFTKYGLVDGRVTQVSGDAIQDEKLGLVYAARVAMARDTMVVDGREVTLSPGMAVTVEIKTGERRIIEYLLAPLLRYRAEAMRER